MKPLIIGQAPGSKAKPGEPVLAGRCGQRLADLCGMPLFDFLCAFDRENLITRFPGKSGKGDAFPMTEARLGAARIITRGLILDRTTIMLGDKVAEAFGLKLEPLQWNEAHGARLAMCPHPSGINRWWNDSENEEAARRFWKALALSKALA